MILAYMVHVQWYTGIEHISCKIYWHQYCILNMILAYCSVYPDLLALSREMPWELMLCTFSNMLAAKWGHMELFADRQARLLEESKASKKSKDGAASGTNVYIYACVHICIQSMYRPAGDSNGCWYTCICVYILMYIHTHSTGPGTDPRLQT